MHASCLQGGSSEDVKATHLGIDGKDIEFHALARARPRGFSSAAAQAVRR